MLPSGASWRAFEPVKERNRSAFLSAFQRHDLEAFANRKDRRDISASELTSLLSIPWKEAHPACRYVGAPSGYPLRGRFPEATSTAALIGRSGRVSSGNIPVLSTPRSVPATLPRRLALGARRARGGCATPPPPGIGVRPRGGSRSPHTGRIPRCPLRGLPPQSRAPGSRGPDGSRPQRGSGPHASSRHRSRARRDRGAGGSAVQAGPFRVPGLEAGPHGEILGLARPEHAFV